MTWNHRVVRTAHSNGEVSYAIHEAYYDKKNDRLPSGITAEPVAAWGETPEELRQVLERNLLALNKPVLTLENGKVVEYKE